MEDVSRTAGKREQVQAVERERARVARDMHDELGANLTRIKLLSERIEREATRPDDVISHARIIARASRELAESIDEIVWAIDPRKDRLEHLGSYLIAYTEEFLGCAELSVRFDMPAVLPELELCPQVRHSVFLVLKEALNNVVRHSGASEVRLGLGVRGGMLELELSDNGLGFKSDELERQGRGVGNMQRRLAEIGGTCLIKSGNNGGTRLRVRVPCDPTCLTGRAGEAGLAMRYCGLAELLSRVEFGPLV
jgi:signal transduction histidine kinase